MDTPSPSTTTPGPAPTSPLQRLHPELLREVASFLPHWNALPSFAIASRACRAAALAGAKKIRIHDTPLQLQPTVSHETHAASLARLLGRLEAVELIYDDYKVNRPTARQWARRDPFLHVLGLAFLRLQAPLPKLTRLSVWCGDDDNEPDAVHPLAQALAEGRFPLLTQLHVSCLAFLNQPTNATLLEQALVRGHLTHVRNLDLITGPAAQAVCRGLTTAPADVQARQPRITDLKLQDKSRQHEQLDALLHLPALASLEKLGLHVFLEDDAARRVAVEVVAQWITGVAEGGARALSQLCITLPTGDPAPGMRPLVHALGAGGGAPNLTTLELCGVGRKAMEDVAAVYAAGGLTRLQCLAFRQPRPSEAGPTALFRAVGGTPHRGRSLTRFSLVFVLGDDEELWAEAEACAGAFQWHFRNAQARGIFPNAEMESMAI